MWRLDIDVGCLPQSLCTLVLETWSLMEPGTHQLGNPLWLASPRDSHVSTVLGLGLQARTTVTSFRVSA